MSVVRAVCRAAGILIVTVAGTCVAAALVPVARLLGARADWRPRVMRAWARVVCRLAGVTTSVTGPVPPGSCLLVANHLGYLDIVVLGAIVPAVFVAKADVIRWPILGFASRVAGTVFVNRGNRRCLPSVVADIDGILAGGGTVVVFPEGTSSDGSRVLPFNSSVLEPAVAGRFPVCYAALGYVTGEGDPPAATAVCWWGDMTLVDHLWRFLSLRAVNARIVFGVHTDVGEPRDRRLVARELHREVSRAHATLMTQRIA